MDDTGAKLGSDRDYRKEAQSDEFGRSCSDPNLVPGACIFFGRMGRAGFCDCPQTSSSDFQIPADSMTISGCDRTLPHTVSTGGIDPLQSLGVQRSSHSSGTLLPRRASSPERVVGSGGRRRRVGAIVRQ